ncbi:ABC transporter substrate-binding protein [Roseomonas sp. CCTCC AB2023176]|uniref:ABC transporter substrate-binding protein n=1 Tax=Roseomonas sp. CCTCC AB2023176 TaxID=3342640 RepID=UPI0035DD9699
MTDELSTHIGRRAALAGVAGAAALSLGGRGAAAQGAAREAPDLARQVAANALPPLNQRLPSDPLVVTPVERVGRHGGTLRRGLRGSADHNGILRLVGNQGLTRWNLQFTDVLPGVASRWEVSADATEFTFHLRPGMRWSDGQPFTADDVVFSMTECLGNSELYRSYPSLYVVNGRPPEVTKVSDTAVRFKFAGPYGLFLQQLATPLGQHATLFPRHYARHFMPGGDPDLLTKARAAGYSDWPSFFRARMGDIEIPSRWSNPQKPTLDPWVIQEPYTGGSTRVTMRRNPYFWQVDTQGNQLPYIDGVTFSIAQDVESLMLDAIGGRLDIQERHLDSLQNKPTLARNAQRGGYRVFDTTSANSQQMSIYLNIVHKDPAMRAMLGNKDFRVALSHAIDRAEIIEAVYLGQGEPWQHGPRPGHPWYHEKLARQYTELDRNKSNQMLDALGYSRRDSANFRLRPDGQRVAFTINVIPTLNPDHVDALELVKRHWAAVGVDMRVGSIERALFYTRMDANDHDAMVWLGPGGLDPMLDARDYVAMHPQGSLQAIPWAQWYASNGREGQEPNENMRERMRLYDEAKTKVNVADQAPLMKRVFDLAADAFEIFGVSLSPNLFGIAVNRLKNVPNGMPQAWSWPNPGPSMPQQYFFEG